MKFVVIMFSMMSMCLVACSDQSYIEKKETQPSSKLSDENVFKDYETALDKAKGVEQTILDAAEQRQKDMQGRGY
ncbi:MAG: hypothetical protein AAF304_09455 [Pseudomonadota bacterium]